MEDQPFVIDDALEVRSRLLNLGVTSDELLEAVGAGISARAGCTKNDPPMFPGVLQFAVTVRTLREIKALDGWTRNDYKNFSTVVSPDGVAIAIARGDDGTGNREATVSTKYPKGAATQEAVKRNLSLPFDACYEADNNRTDGLSTWFLLHSRIGDEVNVELSHPMFMAGSGYIDEWDVRLILTPVPISDTRLRVDDEPVESVVPVKRREHK